MEFFSDIFANEPQKEYYKNAILLGKLHHANIIAGNEKSARHLFAQNIIAALACSNKYKRPCLECENCKAIRNNASADVMYIKKPEDKTTVLFEQIRDMLPFVMRTPHSLDFIAVVIDIDNMDVRTQNTLLKTLEEPPKNVYFFLIAKDISTVLPTVISRCHVEYTQNFTADEIYAYLLENSKSTDKGKMKFAASLSQGSIGKALEILSGEGVGEIKVYEFAKDIIATLFSENATEFDFVTKFSAFSQKREDYQRLIPHLLKALMELMLVKEGISTDFLFFDGDEQAEYVSCRVSAEMIMKMKDIILEFAKFLKSNLILKTSCTLIASKIYECKK